MRSWILAAVVFPAVLLAQPARPGCAKVRRGGRGAWWNSPMVQNLDLSEAQQKDIRAYGAGVSRAFDGFAGSGAARR